MLTQKLTLNHEVAESSDGEIVSLEFLKILWGVLFTHRFLFRTHPLNFGHRIEWIEKDQRTKINKGCVKSKNWCVDVTLQIYMSIHVRLTYQSELLPTFKFDCATFYLRCDISFEDDLRCLGNQLLF